MDVERDNGGENSCLFFNIIKVEKIFGIRVFSGICCHIFIYIKAGYSLTGQLVSLNTL